MISSSAFDILLSILVFGICLNQLNASSQATLAYGLDETTGSPRFLGSTGSPGQKIWFSVNNMP